MVLGCLSELRSAHGLSQVELAKALHVSKQTVSNWENNNILPSVEMAIKIADFFSVSTDYLFGRDNRPVLDVSGLTTLQIAHLQSIIHDFQQLNVQQKDADF